MARRGFSMEAPESATDEAKVSDRVARAEADSLEDFRPRPPRQDPKPEPVRKRAPKKQTEGGWPSREAKVEAEKEKTVQLHIHGPQSVADRFNAMCKEDRRSRWAMLEILMDKAEGKQ